MTRKKMLLGGVILLVLFSLALPAIASGAAAPIKLVVDGKDVQADVPPYLDKAGRTMVPIRFVVQALGAQVNWDSQAKLATVTANGVTIVLQAGQKNAQVNGKATTMDTVAVIKNGRVMVPLRFVGESLEATVQWEAAQRAVVISTAKASAGVEAAPAFAEGYFPPAISHPVAGRETCNVCHSTGVAGATKFDHPDRVNCQQCHVAPAPEFFK